MATTAKELPILPPEWSPLIGVTPPGHWQATLQAGAVRAVIRDGDVYDVTVDGVPWAQRIYLGVRDSAWNTLPYEAAGIAIEETPDRAVLTCTLQTTSPPEACGGLLAAIDLTVTLEAPGTIEVAAVIRPLREFRAGKIGLCVLHDSRTHVGAHYRAWGPGTAASGVLGHRIDPQLFVDGSVTAMFDPFDHLTLSWPDGRCAEWRFTGDTFEMQDHRNWADLSFKTYSTPQRLGWSHPFTPAAAQRQSVRLHATAPPTGLSAGVGGATEGGAPGAGAPGAGAPAGGAPAGADDGPTALVIGPLVDAVSGTRLRLGSDHRAPLPAGATPLHASPPDHLRVTVTAAATDEALVALLADVAALGAAVEVLIVLAREDEAEAAVAALGRALRRHPVPIGSVQVSSRDAAGGEQEVPAPSHLAAVAAALAAAGLPPVSRTGTTSHFCAVNRAPQALRPGTDAVIGVTTQLHLSDSETVLLNARSLSDIADTLRLLAEPDAALHASPVTLIGRDGPCPTGPVGLWGQPAWLDPRLLGCYGAAWSVAMLAALTAAGFTSATLLETSGPRGFLVAGREEVGGMAPAAAVVVPAFHVLADVLAAAAAGPAEVGDPDRLVGLTLIDAAGGASLLCASIRSHRQRVRIRGLPDPVWIRLLDEESAYEAMTDPVGFRGESGWRVSDGSTIELGPYATLLCQTRGGRPQ